MLEQEVWQQLKAAKQAGQSVLLAVSGGVDSMVLLHLVQHMPVVDRPQFAVAHVHHQLRPEAAQECEDVLAYCRSRGIVAFSHVWTPPQPQRGIEQAARQARYHFFAEVMAREGYDILCTAHHQDDQVETVLMRLTRGSTLSGVAGMRVRRPFASGQLWRPLLSYPKCELQAYATKHHVWHSEDASNASLVYTRNRFRHQVVPLLVQENPQVGRHIQQFSEMVHQVCDSLAYFLEPLLTQLVQQDEAAERVAVRDWQRLPDSVQQQLMAFWLQRLQEQHQVSYRQQHIDACCRILQSVSGHARCDLPNGWQLERHYDQAVMQPAATGAMLLEAQKLPYNQWVALPNGTSIGVFDIEHAAQLPPQWRLRTLEGDSQQPYYIRHRQPGDWLWHQQPSGWHRKLLRRWLIDRKVPQAQRDSLWLVVDEQGCVQWISNQRLSNGPETDKMHKAVLFMKTNEVTTC